MSVTTPGSPEAIQRDDYSNWDRAASAFISWQFSKAWVCKWEGPDFDASKNEISIETIEIAHEGTKL